MIDTAKRETLALLGAAAAGAMMTSAAGAQNAASARPEVRSSMAVAASPSRCRSIPQNSTGCPRS